MNRPFFGWWIVAAAFLTFGIAVGIPYYGMPFFYDYYEKPLAAGGFGWSRPDITLGFPLAALLTLWVGPVLVHRFSPRKMILIGTACTCLAFLGFGNMTGAKWMYYGLWFLYVVGYIFSGPIAHQVIISQWFKKRRGVAMAVCYLGVGIFGALSAKAVAKPLTEAFGFRGALQIIAGMMLLTWPIALWIMKDKPSEIGQFPDGMTALESGPQVPPKPFNWLWRQPAFWLLVLGSFCSIGSIGSINQHMKLVFKDQGFQNQAQLNTLFADTLFYIMISSTAGRLIIGWMADNFQKKYVMTATYLLVAITIPLMLMVRPGEQFMGVLDPSMVFAILFGFGMGADYMLIPLMAAEQFGVNTLARAMAIILPTDTIGQTWFPYFVSLLREHYGDYNHALIAVFVLALVGAVAIALMPRQQGKKDEPIPLSHAEQAPAGR